MRLADFQSLFQARMIAGAGDDDRPLLDALRSSPRGAEAETLFGVYQSGYRVRLAEFLAEDHAGLRGLLGNDDFDALVDDYIAAGPARHPNARYYTTGLPEFMKSSARWRDNTPAISMALFERAMVDAFDAPDTAPLTIDALSKYAPEEWPQLAFTFHPGVTLLELSAGTLEVYDAVMSDADGAPERPPGGMEYVSVWRSGEDAVYRALAPDEYVALSEARAGHAFGDICQLAAFQQAGDIEPARLAQCLASWFADEMVTAVSVSRA